MDIDSTLSGAPYHGQGRAAGEIIYFDPRVMRNPLGVSHVPFGAHGARETPVPMPNTAVKPRRGYNTWGSPLGK